MERDLQGQSRLSYAGFTADKHQRTLHKTATEDTVHLSVAKRDPLLVSRVYLRQKHRLMCSTRNRHSLRLFLSRCHSLLHHSIPFPARRTPAHPFRTLVSALLAEPHALCLYRCHICQLRSANLVERLYKKKILLLPGQYLIRLVKSP